MCNVQLILSRLLFPLIAAFDILFFCLYAAAVAGRRPSITYDCFAPGPLSPTLNFHPLSSDLSLHTTIMADLDDQLLEGGIDLSSEEHNSQINNENSMSFDLIENGQSNNADSQTSADSDLEVIRARVREMEEEAEKLKKLQSQVDQEMSNTPVLSSANSSKTSATYNLSEQEKAEADARSVYVGNVDYAATAEELEAHFHGCGSINRVTILCNKFDGHPKGFAYIEFADMDSVNTAMAMDDSLFRGRQIKVNPKRTNKPGISTTNRPVASRGRAMYRGRPMSRGGAQSSFYGGYRPSRRPRGGYSRRAMYYPY